MKKLLSAISVILAIAMLLSASMFALAANDPTTEELEKIIKTVKPKLDIPEEATEFNWNYSAGNVYSDASWRLIWNDIDNKLRYTVRCDENGRILDYYASDYSEEVNSSVLPSGTKASFEETAFGYITKLLPEAAASLELTDSYSDGIYSKTYTYIYSRYENGFPLTDNSVSVSLNYTTGKLVSLNASYNYDVKFTAPSELIGDEKAKKLLSTKQEMKLIYISKSETNDDKTVVKAILVYAPQKGYAAVDAVSGEIYDTKYEWSVRAQATGASMSDKNMAVAANYDTKEEAASADEYILSDKETAQVDVLAKLITKDSAVKVITENKYLYLPTSLTAVDGRLNKNYQTSESYYQDDRGSYTWNLGFSNPVIEDSGVYRHYDYVNATVNADNGNLVGFSSNLRNHWEYKESGETVPEVKYDVDEAQKIAEDFLKTVCADKFALTELASENPSNIITYKNIDDMTDPVFGAYEFKYVRMNEGIAYNNNYIYVGVDGVTGKVYEYSYRWNTNIAFESPKGVITPEKALEFYVNLGLKTVYEINTTYIYIPANEKSKEELLKAFVLSLSANMNNGGNIEPIIKKYAKDIDRDELLRLLNEGNEEKIFEFIGEYYGVKTEAEKLEEDYRSSYSEKNDFYDREESSRLVYTLITEDVSYISPFDGKGLDGSGEAVTAMKNRGYTYDDISGHWAEETIKLLGEIGVGFEGGKFEPNKAITGKEFCDFASRLNFSLWNETKPSYKLCKSENAVPRIDAIKYILTCIDYDKVAVLKNIFRTDFADNSGIKEEDIGYVAIAFALGFVNGDGEVVRTYDNMTRAEAVTILVNAATAVK